MSKRSMLRKGLTVLLLSWNPLPWHATPVAGASVVVPAGTSVQVRVTQDMSSAKNKVGDEITFEAVSDIIVRGRTVIAAGSKAKGHVLRSGKNSIYGVAGLIGVKVDEVEAIDGTPVPLLATKKVKGEDRSCSSMFCMLITGGAGKIPAGTILDAATLTPVEVGD